MFSKCISKAMFSFLILFSACYRFCYVLQYCLQFQFFSILKLFITRVFINLQADSYFLATCWQYIFFPPTPTLIHIHPQNQHPLQWRQPSRLAPLIWIKISKLSPACDPHQSFHPALSCEGHSTHSHFLPAEAFR